VDRGGGEAFGGGGKHALRTAFPFGNSPQSACGELSAKTSSILVFRGCRAAFFLLRRPS
jgi:hypothetical protein